MTTPANSINEATTGIVGFTGTAFTATAVTQHDVLLGGATSSTLTNVAPSATSGIPLVSTGAASDPSFTTAVVAGGGTGQVTLTNHGVLVGAGTSAITQLTVGTNGQVLIGSTTADPAFATLSSSAGSISYTTGAHTLNLDVLNWVTATTFSPVLAFGGLSVGITYAVQIGKYQRVGNVVTFMIDFTLSSKGSSTGAATITLPVASAASGSVDCPAGMQAITAATATVCYLEIAGGSSTGSFIFIAQATGGGSGMADTNFQNGTVARIQGSYFV